MSKNKLVGKITFKSVCGSPELQPLEIMDENGKPKTVLRGVERPYMRVAGIVRKMRIVATNYGDSIEFLGDIAAINIETGEVFDSGKLFLPQVAESFVYNALATFQNDENFTGIEVAFDVGVKPASNAVGYEYTIAPLIENKASAAQRLLASLPNLPQLPDFSDGEKQADSKKAAKKSTDEKPAE